MLYGQHVNTTWDRHLSSETNTELFIDCHAVICIRAIPLLSSHTNMLISRKQLNTLGLYSDSVVNDIFHIAWLLSPNDISSIIISLFFPYKFPAGLYKGDEQQVY